MSITNISGHMQKVLVIGKNTWELNGTDSEWTADVHNYPSGLELKLSVFTCFFCPILCALACACRSFCGFQSESNITTVSADAKLIPNPPALVDSKKQKSWNHKVRNIFIYSTCNIPKGTDTLYALCGTDYKITYYQIHNCSMLKASLSIKQTLITNFFHKVTDFSTV